MEILFLDAQEVKEALPMAQAISAMKLAFQEYSLGQAEIPLRTRIDVSEQAGSTLFMPALLTESNALAVKVVSVFPGNASRNLPTLHAIVIAIDPQTGAPNAILEGASLTAIRTGAASGVATECLARDDARSLAIIGSGTQARTQLEAVCAVREITSVQIFSLNVDEAEEFCDSMSRVAFPSLKVAGTADEAIADADIICTATTSSKPVFDSSIVKPGTHINAIGSFTPEMQEVDLTKLLDPLIVVDSREAVLAESGDLIIPIQSGYLQKTSIHAELGEILSGRVHGRQNEDQITYFKSVGLAVQDAIAAASALDTAKRTGLGRTLTL
jgi:alanine dehydrogenase